MASPRIVGLTNAKDVAIFSRLISTILKPHKLMADSISLYIPVLPGNAGFSKSRSVHIRGLKAPY